MMPFLQIIAFLLEAGSLRALTLAFFTAQALATLQACSSQVASLALFSTNEEVDDVTTSHLKYLLLPHLQAEVLARTLQLTPAVRRQLLQQAVIRYCR